MGMSTAAETGSLKRENKKHRSEGLKFIKDRLRYEYGMFKQTIQNGWQLAPFVSAHQPEAR